MMMSSDIYGQPNQCDHDERKTVGQFRTNRNSIFSEQDQSKQDVEQQKSNVIKSAPTTKPPFGPAHTGEDHFLALLRNASPLVQEEQRAYQKSQTDDALLESRKETAKSTSIDEFHYEEQIAAIGRELERKHTKNLEKTNRDLHTMAQTFQLMRNRLADVEQTVQNLSIALQRFEKERNLEKNRVNAAAAVKSCEASTNTDNDAFGASVPQPPSMYEILKSMEKPTLQVWKALDDSGSEASEVDMF